jgi:hypothetical protein
MRAVSPPRVHGAGTQRPAGIAGPMRAGRDGAGAPVYRNGAKVRSSTRGDVAAGWPAARKTAARDTQARHVPGRPGEMAAIVHISAARTARRRPARDLTSCPGAVCPESSEAAK